MFAAWPELLVAGTPFGSPNPPVCTSSRGFFKVGIAELPVPTLPGVNVGGISFATSGASGAAVFLFEVAGLVIGDVNTGVWMRGFGGTTIAGLGISLATSTLGMIFSTGLGGCGLNGVTGGASMGMLQYLRAKDILSGMSKGMMISRNSTIISIRKPAPKRPRRDSPSGNRWNRAGSPP